MQDVTQFTHGLRTSPNHPKNGVSRSYSKQKYCYWNKTMKLEIYYLDTLSRYCQGAIHSKLLM